MTPSVDQPHCDYCGLPIAGAPSPATEARYCCYGCRFAASVTQASGETGEARWTMTRLGLALFCSMNVMVFTMFLWSQPETVLEPAAAILYDVARYACLLFTTPVLLLLGAPLLDDAWRELRRGKPSLNLLLVSGVGASFLYSLWAVWNNAGHVYFEVACMVLVAVTLGRWLEASGKLRTTEALRALQQLLPDQVRRVASESEELVPLGEVVCGDQLRVLPGEHLPTDGRIDRGQATLDERTVTGESVPVAKQAGDVVYSGTLNLDGELIVEVTSPPGAGTLERLIAAVMSAADGKERFQRLADTISAWFLPIVLIIAALTFVWHGTNYGLAPAILAALAVVVISCPCALGLATPLALWSAVGAATQRHILVRDGDAFSKLADANVVCFDKTGTLTTGCELCKIDIFDGFDRDAVLAMAAALANASTHVLSQAICDYAAREGVSRSTVTVVRTVAGRGVEGRLAHSGVKIQLGSQRWMTEQGLEDVLPPSVASDQPRCLLAYDGRVVAAFLFQETLRPEAMATFAQLREQGLSLWLLSGDGSTRVTTVAKTLGAECRAELLPQHKLTAIQSLQDKHGVVMVGDGLNDAPALATADVGIALGCGADVSRWSASICLLRDDLSALPWLMDLSRRTTSTIRWNLLWAFGYNAVCIPLAAGGWLHPAIAAAAMVISSLFVVSNSLRLTSEAMPFDEEALSDRKAVAVAIAKPELAEVVA